ncbi:hypothetical protein CVT24_011743 [Panaeolus cyanescens]|uniref:Peptidase S8/S53 domain-containing protein n=1 Tax=Panaeolus cyanescens TaxID=181874 RepID=A0A409YNL7_9AGAR|nr:hypothetical protein CVT24_011743 [Panaeolus cyanescens]
MHFLNFILTLSTTLPLACYALPTGNKDVSAKAHDISTSSSQALGVGSQKLRKCTSGKPTGRHVVKVQKGRPLSSVQHLIKSKSTAIKLGNVIITEPTLTSETITALTSHADVVYVAEDCLVQILDINTPTAPVVKDNKPWGVARLSSTTTLPQTGHALAHTHVHHKKADCVDVYVVDSGVDKSHPDFEPGQVEFGANYAPGYAVDFDKDDNGHGTHVAGIIGSKRFGVAEAPHIISVKVSNSRSELREADIVEGLAWTWNHIQYQRTEASKNKQPLRPAVINLSFSQELPPNYLEDCLEELADDGIHIVVTAGNKNKDAHGTSPARSPHVITVGAMNILDKRSSFSNYGDVVDIYAPGTGIVSTWSKDAPGPPEAVKFLDGTSQAAPHVTGLISELICMQFPAVSPKPADIKRTLIKYALIDKLQDIREPVPVFVKLLYF